MLQWTCVRLLYGEFYVFVTCIYDKFWHDRTRVSIQPHFQAGFRARRGYKE